VLFNSRAICTPSEGLSIVFVYLFFIFLFLIIGYYVEKNSAFFVCSGEWLGSPALTHSVNSDTTSQPSTGRIVMSLGDFVLK
jgi:hypothetical protein